MTQLPLDQAIPRFKGNEERVDKLVNGTDLEVWTTANGVVLPTFAKFLKDKEAEYDLAISGPVARAETAAIASEASATAADASADAAAAILAEIQSGATNLVEKNFVGNGVQINWPLDYAPKADENVLIWVGGSIQDTSDYSITGTTLTITPAVPNLVKIRTLIIATATLNEITQYVEQAQAAAALAAGYAKYTFDTDADFVAADIPENVQVVELQGNLSAGDGGGHKKLKISTPTTVEPWHKQSADGAWWTIFGTVSAIAFGARANSSLFDSAPAITAALKYSAAKGYLICEDAYSFYQGSPITIPDNARAIGANYETYIVKMPTYSGPAFRSEYFDFLTGSTDAFAPEVPETIQFDYFTFVGNYQNTARTAYLQTSGQGLQIFARKVRLRSRVFNMQGVGVWLECPGGNGPAPLQPGFSREADIKLYIHQTQYENLVYKGPPDVELAWVLAADAGSRIISEQLNGKVSSPTYGSVNGGQTFCVVFDGRQGEIGKVHTFGNYAGGGIHWLNGGRINAELLMAESCHYGGIKIEGAAQGIVSKIDVHRTGGFNGDNTADFIYAGTGANNHGLQIGVLDSYRSDAANLGARNNVEITGDFINIGVLKIDNGSTATAGHGLYIDNDSAQWISINGGEIARCKGVAPDGLESSGVYRKTTGTGSNVSIEAIVRDCDVAFRSVGTPRVEEIDIQAFLNTGQTMFVGDIRTNNGQKWDVRGTVNGVWKGSKVALAFTFDSTITTVQSQSLAHNLIAAPAFARMSSTLVDIGSNINLIDTPARHMIADYNATDVVVEYYQPVATGSNTTPRVWVTIEI